MKKSISKFILKINGKYFVDLKESESKRGKGAYCNGAFDLHSCLPANEIIVSDKESEACVIDGRMNLKSYIDRFISNHEYSFKSIEIIEKEE